MLSEESLPLSVRSGPWIIGWEDSAVSHIKMPLWYLKSLEDTTFRRKARAVKLLKCYCFNLLWEESGAKASSKLHARTKKSSRIKG